LAFIVVGTSTRIAAGSHRILAASADRKWFRQSVGVNPFDAILDAARRKRVLAYVLPRRPLTDRILNSSRTVTVLQRCKEKADDFTRGMNPTTETPTT
jgi:hypothetical protein